MGNILDTVGNNATLLMGNSGTLTNDGTTKVGTLTGTGVNTGTVTAQSLTGVLGDGVLTALLNCATLTLYDCTPNTIKVAKVDTTKLDSRAETSQAGIPDYGEFEAVVPYTSANTKLFNSAIAQKQNLFFQNTLDDFSTTDSAEVFMGWIMEWTPMGEKQEKNKAAQGKLKICITGVPVFNPGS